MIPIWNEDSVAADEFRKMGCPYEACVFCHKPTNKWHENTNSPVCQCCAKTRKVSELPEDHGQRIRARKRAGTFDRGDSTRAN